MGNWRVSPALSVVFALLAWAIATVSFSGIILAEDLTGRMIFGAVGTLIGVVWWGQYVQAKKKTSSSPANQAS
jgi:hypothetical protein